MDCLFGDYIQKTTRIVSQAFDTYKIGQLLQLRAEHTFVKLHPYFVQPNQIWEPLQVFWDKKSNRDIWGVRDVMGPPALVPTGALEWVTAIKMECAWDVAAKYKIDQRDLAKEIYLIPGDMLMVMEVIVTPWKKMYRYAGGSVKRQRFSYVRFLATYRDKPIYIYHDVSHVYGTYISCGIDPELFDLLS